METSPHNKKQGIRSPAEVSPAPEDHGGGCSVLDSPRIFGCWTIRTGIGGMHAEFRGLVGLVPRWDRLRLNVLAFLISQADRRALSSNPPACRAVFGGPVGA
jgi:hypothetical protein